MYFYIKIPSVNVLFNEQGTVLRSNELGTVLRPHSKKFTCRRNVRRQKAQ